MKRLTIIGFFGVMTFCAARANADNQLTRDGSSILGKWSAPVVLSAGKVSRWIHEINITDEHIVIRRGDGESAGDMYRYTVDESKTPHEISMIGIDMVDVETGLPQKLNAIYRISAKDLRIAFLPGRNGSSRAERPRDLTSTRENKAIVLVLVPNHAQDNEI